MVAVPGSDPMAFILNEPAAIATLRAAVQQLPENSRDLGTAIAGALDALQAELAEIHQRNEMAHTNFQNVLTHVQAQHDALQEHSVLLKPWSEQLQPVDAQRHPHCTRGC